MKTVTTREAQHHLAKVMQVVEGGEEVVITRRGKKVAKVVPFIEEDDQPVTIPDFRNWRDSVGIQACGGPNTVIEIRNEE